jgi:hypothetical protein
MHGIRNVGQLFTLRKDNDVTGFSFPLNTTLHVGIRNIGEVGLPQEDELLINVPTRALTGYIGEYSGNVLGAPIKPQRMFVKEIKDFLKRNKKYKWINQSKSWIDIPGVPYIVNYCSLDKSYKYRARDGVDYWRKVNFFNTVIDNVASELKTSNRTQFVYFDIPQTLPSISRLSEAEQQLLKNAGKELPIDRRLRTVFGSDGGFLLLQLWVWAGEHRELSIFSKLPEDQLNRVTFMTSLDGRYSILNLGTFKSWIKSATNPNASLAPRRAQMSILRHFMALQQIATLSEDKVIVDEESAKDQGIDPNTLSVNLAEDKLADLIGGDSEYLSELPAEAKLNVDIDANAFRKGKNLNVNIHSKAVKQEPINGEVNDAEDFLFDQMERDLTQHAVTTAQSEVDSLVESENVYRPYTPSEVTPTTKIESITRELSSDGLMSSAEVRRALSLGDRYTKIKSPFNPDQTLDEYMAISKEELAIGEVTPLTNKPLKGIIDESMLNYSLKDFKSRYINDIMGKDIVNAALHFQKAGIAVTDMNLTRVDEFLGSYNILSVQLTPVVGKPTTVRFKYPVIDEDGVFVSNGVKYKLKIQRNELPIRKVNFDSVALNSYMSKMFVNRTPRVAYNYSVWLVNQINLASMDANSGITNIKHGDVHEQLIKLPLSYTAIAREIVAFDVSNTTLHFDYSKLERNFTPEQLGLIDLTKFVPIGVKQSPEGDTMLAMAADDLVYKVNAGSAPIVVGKLNELLGVARQDEPVNYGEVRLLGQDVPIGILLSYRVGLGNLLKTVGVEYRRVKRGSDLEIQDHEFQVVFEDEILIFSRDDQKACLLFNGFNRLKSSIRRLSVYSFDKKDSFASLLRPLQIPLDHMKLWDNIFDVWVDHITRDALLDMGEPTDLVLLFMSAVDKLCDDRYKNPNDVSESLLRGYERIPGMMYDAMFKAVRAFVKTPASKSASVDINPNEVWFNIIQDQTVAPIEESNPVHAIKENEVVVFRGKGGRSSDTMTAKHRQFTKDSIGIISEANVDNGQVGTITYLTADPSVTSLRGKVKPIEDLANVPKTKVQSTAMLLSPGSDQDDSKRCTFTSVMFTSTTFLHDAVPNRVLSGAERTVALRTDSTWAKRAKKGGKVTELTKDMITVTYDDGETESFVVGRYFGTWSGTTIPHEIKSMFKVGDTFATDDILTYNSHFFQPDAVNKNHVIFKRGIRGNILMWETRDTLEDADAISLDFTKRLSTSITSKRYVKVSADHNVELLVNEGSHVESDTILCTLKPPMSGMGSRYSDDALQALDALNTLTPKAKSEGTIERIEVMYTGELDDMSESLQEIVALADNKLYRKNRKLGIPVTSAKISSSYSINGSDVGSNQVVLVYYITHTVGIGNGDKLVVGHQLKTIISNINAVPYVTEDGTVVDIAFSRQSVSNRIVNSMDLQGTSNTVLSLIEKEMIEAYLNKDVTA